MSGSGKSPIFAWRGPRTAGTSTCTTPALPARSASASTCFPRPRSRKSGRSARPDGLIGAIQHPDDGYIQPADLTQALAKGARTLGAEINRQTSVTAIERTVAGEWRVRTDKGDITAEHVVSATGNFARRTGAMVGLDVPVMPVEHQYIVTEPHPAVVARRAAGLPEMGVLRESDSSWYLREENGGFLLGPYEIGAPACYVDGPDAGTE